MIDPDFDTNNINNSPTFREHFRVDENANTARPLHYIDGMDHDENQYATTQYNYNSPPNISKNKLLILPQAHVVIFKMKMQIELEATVTIEAITSTIIFTPDRTSVMFKVLSNILTLFHRSLSSK